MKIAFDVQGTLQGYHSAKVVNLFNILQERGHQVFVWSFGGSNAARDCATDLGLKPVACYTKRTKDAGEEPDVDFAVDDDRASAEILSAGKIIYVNEIPNAADKDAVDNLLKVYGF